jgi:hypothetical protein
MSIDPTLLVSYPTDRLLIADEWLLGRMRRAVEKVEERMLKAAGALERAGVPYAVIGGNAVAAWVATKDESAVRNTRDVDVMLREQDFARAREALEGAGFVYRHAAGLSMFLDGAGAKALDAVHIIIEELSPGDPDVSAAVALRGVRVIELEPLVKIKLSVWRDKDRVHLRDMIGVGLLDTSWLERLPGPLAARLRELIENPE